MILIASVVLILIPLKLLQVEQSQMINQILNSKALVLNKKNNHKHIHKQMVKDGYTHIFTSLEIIFSKKFKKNTLDYPVFTNKLCLLAINEIYLVN